jgi:hypothetical protein
MITEFFANADPDQGDFDNSDDDYRPSQDELCYLLDVSVSDEVRESEISPPKHPENSMIEEPLHSQSSETPERPHRAQNRPSAHAGGSKSIGIRELYDVASPQTKITAAGPKIQNALKCRTCNTKMIIYATNIRNLKDHFHRNTECFNEAKTRILIRKDNSLSASLKRRWDTLLR